MTHYNRNSICKKPKDDFENLQKAPLAKLILFNDDFNTFEWAIESLIDVCNYSFNQAEQLCLIIHFKGQAIIKIEEFVILKSMKEAFLNRGISAKIELIH